MCRYELWGSPRLLQGLHKYSISSCHLAPARFVYPSLRMAHLPHSNVVLAICQYSAFGCIPHYMQVLWAPQENFKKLQRPKSLRTTKLSHTNILQTLFYKTLKSNFVFHMCHSQNYPNGIFVSACLMLLQSLKFCYSESSPLWSFAVRLYYVTKIMQVPCHVLPFSCIAFKHLNKKCRLCITGRIVSLDI